MMATYGCRPHEVDVSHFIDDQHRLQIPDETKTGFRLVIPVYADWVELFNLRNERRRHTKWKASGISQWLYNERQKLSITWKPYSLRHAYAGRLWRVAGSQMDVYTAARLMGHSVNMHERTYRAFIAPYTIAAAAEAAIIRNQQALQQSLSQELHSKQGKQLAD